MGGMPPESDSIPEWRKTVGSNLAPIQYELLPITELFGDATEILEIDNAKAQY